MPTRADCGRATPAATARRGGRRHCLPSGAWAGLWKLTLSSNKLPPDVEAGAIHNGGRELGGKVDQSLSAWYCAPIDQSLKGAWRTPSLRDVAITAPYMHDGYYRTLEDVVWHYNNGGTASGSDDFRDSGGNTTGETDAGAPPCTPPDPQPANAARAARRRSSRSG